MFFLCHHQLFIYVFIYIIFVCISLTAFAYQQVLLLTKYIEINALTLSCQVLANKHKAAQPKFCPAGHLNSVGALFQLPKKIRPYLRAAGMF